MSDFMHFITDPFYLLAILLIGLTLVFQRYQNNNEKQIRDHFKDEPEAIYLPAVSAKHLASTIGTRRDWFKVRLIFTANSIFVFGEGRLMLHTQYYSKLNLPPPSLIWPKKNYIPINKIEFNRDDLIIHYISPHWHKANCTLYLKNVLQTEESETICALLAQGFNLNFSNQNS